MSKSWEQHFATLPVLFPLTLRSCMQKYARDVGDVVRIRNGASLVYSLHTIAFLGASAACLFLPDASLAQVFGHSR